MKTNKKIKLIISMVILSCFISIQQASAQVPTDDLDWYSGTSIHALNEDIWVVNGNNSNYWAALRIQVSNDRAWNMVNQGDLWWGFAANNNDKDQGDEKMRLTADGKLGIGTSAPRGKLDVDGTGDIYLVDDTGDSGMQSIYMPGYVYLTPAYGTDTTFIQARREDNSGSTEMRFRVYDNGQYLDPMHISSQGNVGVGTTNPTEKLHVDGGNISTTGILKVEGTGDSHFGGNVGIGTISPSAKLDVNGTGHFSNDVNIDGNVGIGITSPVEKMEVSGNIKADGVILNIGSFPDYVFEAEYPLMPIKEVEAYIKANKHLPGFPSEDEVIKDGVDLGKLNNLLVEKVEELTLYTIAQEKQIDKLSNELDVLKAQLEILLKKQ